MGSGSDMLLALDPKSLHEAFREWVDTVREHISLEVIAIDGKTIQRSKDVVNGKRPLHVVSAWTNENQLVLGQFAVNEKRNVVGVSKLGPAISPRALNG